MIPINVRAAVVGLLGTGMVCSAASAETPGSGIGVGTRVRVSAYCESEKERWGYTGMRFPWKTRIGTIVESGEDRLSLATDGGATEEVLLDDIVTLEVSTAPSSRGSRAAIGAAVGLGVGAVLGAFVMTEGEPGFIDLRPAVAGYSVVLGTALGAVLGALSGGEKWQNVEELPNDLTVGVAPRTGGGATFAAVLSY